IDQTFSDSEMSVAEVAKKLNVSHSFMTRAFKKAYGLTPVTYRTKLRIFESTKLLLLGGFDVTSAGHQVGFTDTARFNKQFRHLMNTVPSKYCLHKLRKKENS
ncbi:MAG: helix-turn-helix transcriptional regulator, partial [Bdellovibrionales bacterium]|nr:helix-turn-helix transcriptional regulator [Bdellovibrionales bacterium]